MTNSRPPIDAIRDSPIWEGKGHHPHLTITPEGCHVWLGSKFGPCFTTGVVGCCLINHRSPRAQAASHRARCYGCGKFMTQDRIYEQFCFGCWDKPEGQDPRA